MHSYDLSQKHAENPLDDGIGHTFVSVEGLGRIGLYCCLAAHSDCVTVAHLDSHVPAARGAQPKVLKGAGLT